MSLKAIAAVLSVGLMIPALAFAQVTSVATSSKFHVSNDPEVTARLKWSEEMRRAPLPGEGCFHVSYPNLRWDKVNCESGGASLGGITSGFASRWGVRERTVAVTEGRISIATGLFPTVNVGSEESVGGKNAIDGPNQYTLQLNTNPDATTAACKGHSGCTVWQQFVYATDGLGKGKAKVWMQYWLLNFGSKNCPSNWHSAVVGPQKDCVRNSKSVKAPDIAPSDLGGGAAMLSAIATPGGDAVTLFFGSDLWTVGAKDNVVDISSVWNEAEFNILGDAGGSQAQFSGTDSITVLLGYTDGTSIPPFCLLNSTTTGETNNLIPQNCQTGLDSLPFIEFTETRVPPPPPPHFTCAQLETAVTAAENLLHAAQNKLHTPACQGGLTVECLNQVREAEESLTAAEGAYNKQCR